MKTLTVRNLPDQVAEALDNERRRRGCSLNQTVIDLLRVSLGAGITRTNGLRELAGTWSEGDYRTFEAAVAPLGTVDEELWR
jgi:plasmid stability protein